MLLLPQCGYLASRHPSAFARIASMAPLQGDAAQAPSQQKAGLHLYTAAAPSGYRATILLEELGLPYVLHSIALDKGEHLQEEFKQNIAPTQLIPVLFDHDEGGARIMESGAVMLYLLECKAAAAGGEAARVARQLLPPPDQPAARGAVLSWLFWQVSTFYAAMRRHAEPLIRGAPTCPEAQCYAAAAVRTQLRLLEVQLQKTGAYLAGESYTAADIATFPFAMAAANALGVDLSKEMPALHAWIARLLDRPAVRRGLRQPAVYGPIRPGEEGDKVVEGIRSKLRSLGVEDVPAKGNRVALPAAEE